MVLASELVALYKYGGVGQPPDGSYVIHFCPPFWITERMENQLYRLQVAGKDALPKVQREVCNLANLDSTARIMLHEVTQSVAHPQHECNE